MYLSVNSKKRKTYEYVKGEDKLCNSCINRLCYFINLGD